MMCSLPPITPSDPNELWYTPLVAPTHISNDSSSHSRHNPNSRRHHRHNNSSANPSGHHGGPSRTLLGDLRQDETAITARKGNIRRFGAGWLKPPGIGKTLQGLWDEKLEREEAEQAAMREAALAEQQAAQEELEREQQLQQQAAAAAAGMTGGQGEEGDMGGAGGDGAGMMMMGERDLDDDIPEARDDDADDWVSEDDDDDDDDEDGDLEDNEDTFGVNVTGGDEGEGDYAVEVVDVLPDGMDGGMDMMDARDLDDDVPDAGSYEHTDTDADLDDDEYDEGDEEDDMGSDIEVDDETRASIAVPGSAQPAMSAILGAPPFSSSPAGGRRPRRSGGYSGR